VYVIANDATSFVDAPKFAQISDRRDFWLALVSVSRTLTSLFSGHGSNQRPSAIHNATSLLPKLRRLS